MLKCPVTIYADIAVSKIHKIGTPHIIAHRPNKKEVKVSKCKN